MGRHRQLPTGSHPVGFELEAPAELAVEPGDGTLRVREELDGKPVGELEVSAFQAQLVIDRDGVLEAKVYDIVQAVAEEGARGDAPMPVSLPGASGFRADAEVVRPMGKPRPPLPYLYVFAIAPHDLAINGGVAVTVRCAAREWAAADAILRSLRLLGRGGKVIGGPSSATLALPMIGAHEQDE